MSIIFNDDVVQAEKVLREGLTIGDGGTFSFNEEAVSAAQTLFAPQEAWEKTQAGRDAIIAASGKILVDEYKGYVNDNPGTDSVFINLNLGSDTVDHRVHENKLTSSYVARGATEAAVALNQVHQYAEFVFKDEE